VVVFPVSRNARVGAVGLVVGAMLQVIASVLTALATPWAYAGWLVFCFGALCLCEELGVARPLNRGGLVLLGASLCARTILLVLPIGETAVRAELAYAFTGIGAVLLWSVALMHREHQIKGAGLLGSALSGGTLMLLLAGHLAAGGASFFGFSELFAAINRPEAAGSRAMISIAAVIGAWSLIVAGLLSTTALNRTDN